MNQLEEPSLSSFPWCVHPAGHYIKEKERQASIEDEQHKEMKEKPLGRSKIAYAQRRWTPKEEMINGLTIET